MIRIFKDNNIQVVTKGAYEAFYKPLGYNVVVEQKSKKEEVKVQPNNNEVRTQKRTRGSSSKIDKEG